MNYHNGLANTVIKKTEKRVIYVILVTMKIEIIVREVRIKMKRIIVVVVII